MSARIGKRVHRIRIYQPHFKIFLTARTIPLSVRTIGTFPVARIHRSAQQHGKESSGILSVGDYRAVCSPVGLAMCYYEAPLASQFVAEMTNINL